jgi:hypothetical protein
MARSLLFILEMSEESGERLPVAPNSGTFGVDAKSILTVVSTLALTVSPPPNYALAVSRISARLTTGKYRA